MLIALYFFVVLFWCCMVDLEFAESAWAVDSSGSYVKANWRYTQSDAHQDKHILEEHCLRSLKDKINRTDCLWILSL
ncbi:hypothetical protein H6P81_013418 [Aristolochia fimbriata]|uniref:Secreted protein n=1 Tax=Aristolochia fimbriata TaxID=158543 RepID=A0AAV7EEN9_ARIFI|nr:hypothetical protein H6P81_013418 [Aristolochia fimbriata]